MDIFEHLHSEHQAVAELLRQLEGGRDERLFEQLRTDLIAHMRAEEAVLYASLAAHPQTRDVVAEGMREHRRADQLLGDLAISSSSQWTRSLAELRSAVEHHVEEEEGELFPAAREVLDEHQLETMGPCFEQEEMKHKAA